MFSVLAHYPPDCAPRVWTKAASGFSGAEVYRLETARGTLALRRWPAEHPSPERLTWIHTVLTQAVANGFDRLPLPIRTIDTSEPDRVPLLGPSSAEGSATFVPRDTFVAHGGHLWELAPWLPGEADFHLNPSPARLTAAMQALAQLHLAMANHPPSPQAPGCSNNAPSPGLAARLAQLRELRSGAAETVPGTVSANREFGSSLRIETVPGTVSSALLSAAHEILTHFERLAPDLERQLAAHVDRPVPLQPALRDILDEHVLFVGDQVTGIIDFGAMRIESVAGDIARLLGSLVPRSSFNTAIAPTPRASIERSMEKVSGTFSTMPVGRPSVDIEKVPDTFSVANDTPGATARLPNDALSNVALGWQAGLSAYESVRPLSPLERELVDVFDRSGLLLGGMNWLQWLFVEGRQFADLPRVHARLTTILARLRG